MQDVIAPDVRELKARVDSLEHRTDDRFKSLEQRMDDRFIAADQKLEAQIGKVLAAIASMKNESELTAVREVSALRERVAVLEIQLKRDQKAA